MAVRKPIKQSVLLISCPDEKGLISKVTGLLFRRGLNITENAEYVDRIAGLFFMRTEFSGEIEIPHLQTELQDQLGSQASVDVRDATQKKKILLLGTREAHCLGDLLLRHEQGELRADILGVISQYPDLERLAKRFEIPFECIPVESEDRSVHEAALLKAIAAHDADYLVLAKYMRILSPDFVSKFSNRMINIHHSFLPAFIGKNPYAQAYERGVKIIGATAHFVNENLDEGPIINQAVIPISHTQDAQDLARAGRDVEKIVLARALRLVLEDRVIVNGRRTLVFE